MEVDLSHCQYVGISVLAGANYVVVMLSNAEC